MSENLESMFRIKQDECIELCVEIDAKNTEISKLKQELGAAVQDWQEAMKIGKVWKNRAVSAEAKAEQLETVNRVLDGQYQAAGARMEKAEAEVEGLRGECARIRSCISSCEPEVLKMIGKMPWFTEGKNPITDALLVYFRAVNAALSPDPARWMERDGHSPEKAAWGIVDPNIDPVKWFAEHLSFGAGDIHCVWLPEHPRTSGAHPRPDHAVLLAIVGNGSRSEANAKRIVELWNTAPFSTAKALRGSGEMGGEGK